ncbi:GRF1-interacting factor 2 [Platanthera guangdongensis]|uniref:GRF1-interacting factor 2 n=1 Tax=Platanthera guangdongensis TaxID=2320717 RepID=A0ABR2LWK6_9ASPA
MTDSKNTSGPYWSTCILSLSTFTQEEGDSIMQCSSNKVWPLCIASLGGLPCRQADEVESPTELRYLDENKQLILAILDNQNSGKAEECAE